jgi:hypothetical protein
MMNLSPDAIDSPENSGCSDSHIKNCIAHPKFAALDATRGLSMTASSVCAQFPAILSKFLLLSA